MNIEELLLLTEPLVGQLMGDHGGDPLLIVDTGHSFFIEESRLPASQPFIT